MRISRKRKPELSKSLEIHALKFYQQLRDCIESGELGDRFSSRFPRGCCGDTSVALASYLESKGFCNVCIASDEDGHQWVEVEKISIDLTSHQFESCDDIIIATNSEWHTRRQGVKRCLTQDMYNPDWSSDLRDLLNQVVVKLK
jgi:hypothetical protein